MTTLTTLLARARSVAHSGIGAFGAGSFGAGSFGAGSTGGTLDATIRALAVDAPARPLLVAAVAP